MKGDQLELQHIRKQDYSELFDYLIHLSSKSKNQFEPHPYAFSSIETFYQKVSNKAVIARDQKKEMIAYFVYTSELSPEETSRLANYSTDISLPLVSLAPSVADPVQGQNIGTYLFKKLEKMWISQGYASIVLWGGVQAQNKQAVSFYKKNGFKEIGKFDHNGENYDMIKKLERVTGLEPATFSLGS